MSWWEITLRLVLAVGFAFLLLRLLVALLLRWEAMARDAAPSEETVADRLRRAGGL